MLFTLTGHSAYVGSDTLFMDIDKPLTGVIVGRYMMFVVDKR